MEKTKAENPTNSLEMLPNPSDSADFDSKNERLGESAAFWSLESQRRAYLEEADRAPEVESSEELLFGCRFDPVSSQSDAAARSAKLKDLGRRAFAIMRSSK